jgi:PPM family protein phosphatase
MFQLDVAARSHRGLVRTTNEDSGFAGASLVLVADGVGGSNAGEVASSTAAHIAAGLSAHWPDTDPLALLGAVVDRASEQLRADVATAPDHLGASTTLTAIHTDGARFGLVHLGDSRAYLLRGRRLHRLTRDHTFVQQLVDAGHLTAEQARHSPYRHQVTRWLGAGAEQSKPDLGRLELVLGDRVLLCSDGLTDLVDDDLLTRLLGVASPDDAAEMLVSAALAAGGRDNVTCVVADVVDRPSGDGSGQLLGAAAGVATVEA